jgi:hypothetical protein
MKGGNIMPNLDRTGPWGLGPMTGRGLGRCARGYGRGHGYGRGFGYGLGAHGRWKGGYYYPQVSSLREDKAFLEEQREYLKDELNYIEKILKEIEVTEKKEE